MQKKRKKVEILEGKNLLIADDDQYNIYALTAALEDFGLNITIARNGKEALQALNDTGNIDMVLMDIMMPEMDGYEAMRAIRATGRYNELPIIAITAKAMQSDIDNCFDAGASDYMSKPIDVAALVDLMRKWLEK